MANGLISSQLDYFYSLLNLCQFQCIQNSAACTVTNTIESTRITSVLKKLHWLPVQCHTVFKTATRVYKFLHSGIPQYFDTNLQLYICEQNTRRFQNEETYLTVPRFQPFVHKSATHFTSSFVLNAPTLWNEIHDEVRASPTTRIFRRKFKAYLFKNVYLP